MPILFSESSRALGRAFSSSFTSQTSDFLISNFTVCSRRHLSRKIEIQRDFVASRSLRFTCSGDGSAAREEGRRPGRWRWFLLLVASHSALFNDEQPVFCSTIRISTCLLFFFCLKFVALGCRNLITLSRFQIYVYFSFLNYECGRFA